MAKEVLVKDQNTMYNSASLSISSLFFCLRRTKRKLLILIQKEKGHCDGIPYNTDLDLNMSSELYSLELNTLQSLSSTFFQRKHSYKK